MAGTTPDQPNTPHPDDRPSPTAGLKAPFPWFGGKSRVAHLVWQRFGNVPHYVEPFAGSLAVLLARPHAPKVETVNDADRYLVNFWRAVQSDPLGVAHYADWPVSEVELRARHDWLVTFGRQRLQRLDDDPDDYDPRIAGWWVWGLCCWIGSGWCPSDRGANARNATLGAAGEPHLGSPGMGVNRKLPHLGNPGMGVNRPQASALVAWFTDLAARLSTVRIACGDWTRVLSDSVLRAGGYPVGVFLDPPYEDVGYYAEDDRGVSAQVRAWAVEHGGDSRLRIALCGYEGEHDLPGWTCVAWKAAGGYGNQNGGEHNPNARRERIWFSPHCLAGQRNLFGSLN